MITQTFIGSTKKKFDNKLAGLQPYVLNNGEVVFTKGSVNRYFGSSTKSDWINEFLIGFKRYGLGATGLLDVFANPLVIEIKGVDEFSITEEAYKVSSVISACEFIIFAKKEGFLNLIEFKFAAIAQTLLDSHKVQPLPLQITELTGLNFIRWKAKQRIADALNQRQKDRAYNWIPTISEEFWSIVQSELETDYIRMAEDPTDAANFVYEWIFSRLSIDAIDDLRNTVPKRHYNNKKRLQDNSNPKITAFVHMLLGLFEISERKTSILKQLLDKTYPQIRRLDPIEKQEIRQPDEVSIQLRNALLSK